MRRSPPCGATVHFVVSICDMIVVPRSLARSRTPRARTHTAHGHGRGRLVNCRSTAMARRRPRRWDSTAAHTRFQRVRIALIDSPPIAAVPILILSLDLEIR